MTAAIKSSVARDTIVLERTYRATPDRVFVLALDGSNVLEGYIGAGIPHSTTSPQNSNRSRKP